MIISRSVIFTLAALLIGIGGTLVVERVMKVAPFDMPQPSGGTISRCSGATSSNSPPAGILPTPITICVEAPTTSPADDFLRTALGSILAAIIGGLIGVFTFLVGQRSSAEKEVRSGQAAVSVVIKELQANRAAVTSALNEPSAGAPAESLSVSVFPEVRLRLAEALPYPLLARTFALYDLMTPDLSKDLRTLDANKLKRLRRELRTLETNLTPHGKEG